MTHPRMTTTDAPVTVEPQDREAAASWCQSQPFPSKQAEAPLIRDGSYDHHSLVQAFARHRLAALASAPAGDGVDLVEALRPFALIAPHVENTDKRDGDVVHRQVIPGGGRAELTKADFRTAASVYSAALARPRAAMGEQSREAPDTITYNPVYFVTYEGSDPSRGYVYTLQSPPAKVEG